MKSDDDKFWDSFWEAHYALNHKRRNLGYDYDSEFAKAQRFALENAMHSINQVFQLFPTAGQNQKEKRND